MPTKTMGTKKSLDKKDSDRRQREARRQQKKSGRSSSDIELKPSEQELVLGVSHHDDVRIISFDRALSSKQTPHIFAYYNAGHYTIKRSHIPNVLAVIAEAGLSLTTSAAASSEISLTGQTLAADKFISLIQAIKKNRAESRHNADVLACVEANLGCMGTEDTRTMRAFVDAINPTKTVVFSANANCLNKVATERPDFFRADSSISAVRALTREPSSTTKPASAAASSNPPPPIRGIAHGSRIFARSGHLRSVTGSGSAIGAQSPTHPGARGMPHAGQGYFATSNRSSLDLGSGASNGSLHMPRPLIRSKDSLVAALSAARPDAALSAARPDAALPAARPDAALPATTRPDAALPATRPDAALPATRPDAALPATRPAVVDNTTESAARATPGEDNTPVIMGRGAPPGGEGCCSCFAFFGRRRTQIAPAPNPDEGGNNVPGMP